MGLWTGLGEKAEASVLCALVNVELDFVWFASWTEFWAFCLSLHHVAMVSLEEEGQDGREGKVPTAQLQLGSLALGGWHRKREGDKRMQAPEGGLWTTEPPLTSMCLWAWKSDVLNKGIQGRLCLQGVGDAGYLISTLIRQTTERMPCKTKCVL